jgi:hypothetical protein
MVSKSLTGWRIRVSCSLGVRVATFLGRYKNIRLNRCSGRNAKRAATDLLRNSVRIGPEPHKGIAKRLIGFDESAYVQRRPHIFGG